MASFSAAHLKRDLHQRTQTSAAACCSAEITLQGLPPSQPASMLERKIGTLEHCLLRKSWTASLRQAGTYPTGTVPSPSALVSSQELRFLQKLRNEGTSLVVGVDGSAHALNDDQVCTHCGVRQRVRHPPEIQAGAALPVARHVQPGVPAEGQQILRRCSLI